MNRLRITPNGDVTIGDNHNNATQKVDILNGSDEDNIVIIRGADTTSEYAAVGVNGGNAIITGGSSGSNNTGIIFRTAASGSETERLRIKSDGEIVINHTQASTPLNNTFISIWDANSDSSAIDASGISKNYAMISLHNYGTGVSGDTTGIGFGAGSAFSYTKGSIAFQRTGSYGTGDLVFLTNNDQNTTMVNDTDEKMRITSGGDLLLGNHGSRIFDDSSGTNVVVDIYGGTTAGKRGILALGGRTGSDNGDIGTIQFVNENNNLATAANHVQSKLVASIDVKSETTDSNSGSDSGGHLLFSTKPETGQITERLRIESDGDIIATGNIQSNNLSARNIVINGDMRVAQRATSASMSSSGNAVPTCDRWQYNRNGPSSTVAQVAETPDAKGFYYSLKWTNTSPVGSIAAGNVVKFSYGVERQDIQRLGYGASDAKTATLSFWAKGSLSGKIGVAFTRDSRIFSANEDIVANTWKFVEITIPADTSTGFSASNNAQGFTFGICWGAGTNSTSGHTGSWINFHNAYTAGFTAGQQGAYLTTNGSTFQITGVQLEIGSVSTPFEHRDYGEELERCFRYYHKDLNRRAYWGSGNVGDRQFPVRFGVEMRDTPTVSFPSTSLDSGSAQAYNKTRQGYNFAMTGSGRFYEWAHIADAEF